MNKELWIQYMQERTGLSVDILEKEYGNIKDNDITIYNSVNGKETIVKATQFIHDLNDHQIIVENGAIFNNHNVFTSLSVQGIQSLKALRRIFKGKMKKALADGDALAHRINYNSQLDTKEGINTNYGIQANPLSKLYNYDVACSITARGRGTVSVNGLALESLFGTYRTYSVVALLDFITKAKDKHVDQDILDLIEVPNDNDIYNHINPEFKDYYGEPLLRAKIKALKGDEKKKVMYTSNYKDFIKIPKIKELLKELILIQNKAYDDIRKLKESDLSENDQLKQYKKYLYLDALDPPANIKDVYNELMRWVEQLLVGFYWYEGDINQFGEDLVAPEVIFKNIERKSIILTDTDSLIFAIAPYSKLIVDMYPNYNELVNNLEGMDEFVLGSFIIAVAGKSIDLGLERYTDHSLITPEYRSNIRYKQEYVFKSLQTTQGAKNYLGVISVQEGVILPNEALDTKGLSLKKTNFNKFLSERAKYIAEHMIARTKTPDPKEIFDEIERVRKQISSIFRAKDNLDVFTVAKLKFGYNNAVLSDFRYKAVENYNILFDAKITLPGAFLITKIDLTDAEDEIQDNYPHIWVKIGELIKKRSVDQTLASIIAKKEKIWVDEQIPEEVNDIISNMYELDNVEDISKYIKYIKSSYKGKEISNELKEFLDSLKVKKVKLADIDKIAIPIDDEVVPEFISAHIDLNEIAVFENLIAVLIKGLGFEVIRNNNGAKQIVHNIISYY